MLPSDQQKQRREILLCCSHLSRGRRATVRWIAPPRYVSSRQYVMSLCQQLRIWESSMIGCNCRDFLESSSSKAVSPRSFSKRLERESDGNRLKKRNRLLWRVVDRCSHFVSVCLPQVALAYYTSPQATSDASLREIFKRPLLWARVERFSHFLFNEVIVVIWTEWSRTLVESCGSEGSVLVWTAQFLLA